MFQLKDAVFKRTGFSLLKVLCVLTLTACAQSPVRPPLDGFAASGRVNIRSAQESNTAQFTWQASPDRDVLALASPLGNILAELTIEYQGQIPVHAQLNRGTQVDAAENPETLLENLTGFALPVSGMRWWLRGLPSPAATYVLNGADVKSGFVQAGWRIIPSDYRNADLPYRLELQRDDIKVRIVINEWSASAL